MSGAARLVIDLEMGYSVAEFAQVLPLAMRDWSVAGRIPEWQVSDASGQELATVSIEPKAERVIGALRLPVLRVHIEFEDIGEPLLDAFRLRFERGFHRGGG